MEQRFEQLNMQAMTLADAELCHIAETEQLDDAQKRRITAMALQKAGIAQNTQKPIRQKRRITRLGVSILAAALTTAALGIGVSGYLRYNKPLAEANFGVLGARRLEEIMEPEPEIYTNGVIDLTVEATIYDGKSALVLATMRVVDPNMEIEWEYEIYPNEWMKADAESESGYCYGMTTARQLTTRHQVFDDVCWVTWEFYVPDPGAAQSMQLEFYPSSTTVPKRNLFGVLEDHEVATNTASDGLQFTVPLIQNTELLTLQSDSGDRLYLSGFRLYGESMNSISGDSFTIDWKDGDRAECRIETIHYSEYDSWSIGSAPIYQTIEGKRFSWVDPTTFNGFVDVTDIEYIECNGRRYFVQPEPD